MRRALKILHTLGSVGLMGGMAACLVLLSVAQAQPPREVAVLYGALDLVVRWLIFPSLPVCLVSGLSAMAVHAPYQDAGWVWAKAATGVVTLEGTFGLIGRARDLALHSAYATGGARGNVVDALAQSERGALWTLIVVCATNVILGVWRPHKRRLRPEPQVSQGRST